MADTAEVVSAEAVVEMGADTAEVITEEVADIGGAAVMVSSEVRHRSTVLLLVDLKTDTLAQDSAHRLPSMDHLLDLSLEMEEAREGTHRPLVEVDSILEMAEHRRVIVEMADLEEAMGEGILETAVDILTVAVREVIRVVADQEDILEEVDREVIREVAEREDILEAEDRVDTLEAVDQEVIREVVD